MREMVKKCKGGRDSVQMKPVSRRKVGRKREYVGGDNENEEIERKIRLSVERGNKMKGKKTEKWRGENDGR